MAKKQYSDEEKAIALAALDANAGDVAHTARQLSIPRKTLENWAKGGGIHPHVANIRQQKKKELYDKLENIAYALAGKLPDLTKGANIQDVTTSLAIVIDKMLLLKGKPTSINYDATPEQRESKLSSLRAKREQIERIN